MERVIYNGSLSALGPESSGLAFYYSSYQPLATKKRTSYAWPCCAGTLPLVTSDYIRDIYFHDEENLYVNLYVNSVVNWKKGSVPVTLEQQTDYPEKAVNRFTISLQKPERFTLHLRIPSWTDAVSVKITVNGAPVRFNGTTGVYYPITRQWKDGDKLVLDFALPDYTLAVDQQHPDLVAFMKGPLMLAGIQPDITPDKVPALTEKGYQAPYKGGSMLFKPFYQVHDEVYTTYFRV
jgi:DUF1680 family protein